jgi:hypothetical protein
MPWASLPPAPQSSLQTILHRMAVPFALFGMSLSVVLSLSWMFLLPAVTRVKLGSVEVPAREISAYAANLQGQITTLSAQRDDLILPIRDALHQGLISWKRAGHDVRTLEQDVREAAHAVSDTIVIRHTAYDRDGMSLILDGEARAGLQSLTVLGGFVDALESLPTVASVRDQVFNRAELNGTVTAPFHLSLELRAPTL